MNTHFTLKGQIVDLIASRIFAGCVTVENGKIVAVEPCETDEKQFIMPGFIDAHIHIESSMVLPSEFARMAAPHGTVATLSDPHEIANVMGMEGVRYMVDDGKRVPFKFFFGAPSCVPSTGFETAGFTLDAHAIETLMAMDDIYFLAEVMNCPGVIFDDPEMHHKLAAARKAAKPIDGHAPDLRGDGLKKYVAAGISTDHECYTITEAEEKIELGMMIEIREGSAAKDFDNLIPLLDKHPDKIMFCSDDKHPDNLLEGHINTLVKRAIGKGCDVMNVLKAASLNVVKHYGIQVGLLQPGDDADFIVVDNLSDLNVKQTYIKGVLVAENGVSTLPHLPSKAINNFAIAPITEEDLFVADEGKAIKVIECIDGQLVTKTRIETPKVEAGNLVSDTERDILKLVVVNRYAQARPAVAFIKNVGLKRGAIASSVAHDSHNIIATGTSDAEIAAAINLVIANKGGIVAYSKEETVVLPLPVAGLMSTDEGHRVAENYQKADALAHRFGSKLGTPFMTLAFMALPVIPELKLSDKGLFDVCKFAFTSLFE